MTDRWRIAVGSDDAGFRYKSALVELLRDDPRVAEVIDVGVDLDEHTAYPPVAIEAAELVARGDADQIGRASCRERVFITV